MVAILGCLWVWASEIQEDLGMGVSELGESLPFLDSFLNCPPYDMKMNHTRLIHENLANFLILFKDFPPLDHCAGCVLHNPGEHHSLHSLCE